MKINDLYKIKRLLYNYCGSVSRIKILNNLYTQKITLNFSFDIQSDEFNLKSSKVFAAEYIKENSDA